jgi:hypothetical protein
MAPRVRRSGADRLIDPLPGTRPVDTEVTRFELQRLLSVSVRLPRPTASSENKWEAVTARRLLAPFLGGQRQFVQLCPGLAPGRVVFGQQCQKPLAVGGYDQMNHLMHHHVLEQIPGLLHELRVQANRSPPVVAAASFGLNPLSEVASHIDARGAKGCRRQRVDLVRIASKKSHSLAPLMARRHNTLYFALLLSVVETGPRVATRDATSSATCIRASTRLWSISKYPSYSATFRFRCA